MSKPDSYLQYNKGYNKARSDVKFDQDKYAQMWAEANAWAMPSKLTKPNNLSIETTEKAFISGAWTVLESLRKDGYIPEEMIDKHWKLLTEQPHD